MEYFPSRLKKIRKDNNMSQKDLANALSYARTTITKYESGKRIPSGKFLAEVSDYFNISLDYLLARSNIKERVHKYQNKSNTNILLLIDHKTGKILDHSPGAIDFYGYSKRELLSKTIFNINTLPDNKIRKILNNASNTIHQTFYFEHKTANGETKNVKAKTTRFELDKRNIIISTINEVYNHHGDNKNIKQELINSLNQLSIINIPYKKEHAKNVENLSYQIGKHLSLKDNQLENIKIASRLKNIGESKIPNSIINKPKKISATEYNLIKEHPFISYKIIDDVSFSQEVGDIILQHHERIDGSGYPYGISNEEIKIEAKIIAVADVFNALLAERPYRNKHGLNKALNYINKLKGKRFNNKVVDILNHIIKNKNYNIN